MAADIPHVYPEAFVLAWLCECDEDDVVRARRVLGLPGLSRRYLRSLVSLQRTAYHLGRLVEPRRVYSRDATSLDVDRIRGAVKVIERHADGKEFVDLWGIDGGRVLVPRWKGNGWVPRKGAEAIFGFDGIRVRYTTALLDRGPVHPAEGGA